MILKNLEKESLFLKRRRKRKKKLKSLKEEGRTYIQGQLKESINCFFKEFFSEFLMASFVSAENEIREAVKSKNMLLIFGECSVEYWGRAASKLALGKRLLMIKGDSSIAIHQNRLLRPTNYMMKAGISTKVLDDNTFLVKAVKQNPKEEIKVFFKSISKIIAEEMNESSKDLRLFGSEKELSDQLMTDLEFIEKGLKPLKQEQMLRKGVIDILAEDSQGKIVVMEVKRRKADFNTVTKLERYVKEVEKLKNKETRGILLAPEIRRTALELLERSKSELIFYKLDFEIGNPKATIKGLQKKQTTLFCSPLIVALGLPISKSSL